jgi:hypothetical protein
VAILEVSVNEVDGILNLSVVDERHYQLVDKNDISNTEIRLMSEYEV